MASSDSDVIIVGAGPAGSTTAALLARRGYSVMIVDRLGFPRSKACGESVNPGAVAELDHLGILEEVRRLPHRTVRGWRVHSAGGEAFRGRFPDGVSGLAIDRELFDQLLLTRALEEGARFSPGVQVTDLLRDGSTVVGVRDREGRAHRARFVVGADGLRSVVMRKLGLKLRPPELVKVGLTAHFEGVRDVSNEGRLFLMPWGCAGLVRISDRLANVVLIARGRGRGRVDGEEVEIWFDRLAGEVPALVGARRAGPVHATGPFDQPVRDVIAAGALLVGDAAGYFDPFTGQGIFRALRGARLADHTIDRVLSDPGNAPDALRSYSRAHRGAFRRGELFQRVVEAATARRRLFASIAAGLGAAPKIADLLIALTGDLPTARSHSGPRA